MDYYQSNMPDGSSQNSSQDHTLVEVINEVNSDPIIRQRLMRRLVEKTGRHVISYVSSNAPLPQAFINDWDAEIIENILKSYGSKFEKIDLILHSGGGFAESAERIVNSMYSYCKDFRVIIPTQAKSAATIVAMGSSKILMSDTSEIGSIDPQLPNGIAAQSVIKAYEELMQTIEEKQQDGKPYEAELVLINKIDPVLLRECRKYMDLAQDIASKLLNKKMRSKRNPINVDEIGMNFLDDSRTFSHGRLIGWEAAKDLGLKIKYIDKNDEIWKLVWEIYIRSKIAIERSMLAKIIEDQNNSLNPGQLPVR
ncbi:hypothetical protein HYS96_02885 [Candidatus Daviesbacteria bacterium]|nr:hypothetical protein [Candidatus Daviesbacteria bacterium]